MIYLIALRDSVNGFDKKVGGSEVYVPAYCATGSVMDAATFASSSYKTMLVNNMVYRGVADPATATDQ